MIVNIGCTRSNCLLSVAVICTCCIFIDIITISIGKAHKDIAFANFKRQYNGHIRQSMFCAVHGNCFTKNALRSQNTLLRIGVFKGNLSFRGNGAQRNTNGNLDSQNSVIVCIFLRPLIDVVGFTVTAKS